MFRNLREDIRAVFDRDPAARSFWEVLTCYPGIHALIFHRLGHWLWGHHLRWLARFTAVMATMAMVVVIGYQLYDTARRVPAGEPRARILHRVEQLATEVHEREVLEGGAVRLRRQSL